MECLTYYNENNKLVAKNTQDISSITLVCSEEQIMLEVLDRRGYKSYINVKRLLFMGSGWFSPFVKDCINHATSEFQLPSWMHKQYMHKERNI